MRSHPEPSTVTLSSAGLRPSPVGRTRLADSVTTQFLATVRSGEWRAGQRLPPERELAALFQVSRGTLRAALQELAFLGFVDVRQGDGTYVCQPGNAVLAAPFKALLIGQPRLGRDLFQLRYIVEPEVARLAAQRCVPSDATRLNALIAMQEALVDGEQRLIKEDLAFHAEVARIAGNQLLLELGDLLRHILESARHQGLPGSNPNHETVGQHRAIADAVIAREADRARDAMAAHLRWVIAGAGFNPADF